MVEKKVTKNVKFFHLIKNQSNTLSLHTPFIPLKALKPEQNQRLLW